MFDIIDATGSGDKRDPRMRNVEAEMIRSHELCLNKGATILSPGKVVIEDNVLIGPEVKIATVRRQCSDWPRG